jgi:hypothetical protein
MFTARVIADGKFFIGAIEVGKSCDAYKLEQGKKYSGHVLDNMPTNTHYVEFSKAAWGTFDADELEDL